MKRIDLVVVLGEELRFFSSVEAAAARLEPRDIRAAARIQIFDRAGIPHRLQIDDNGWGQETLRFTAITDTDAQPAVLATLLGRFLSARGAAVRQTSSLDALLRRIEPFCEA